MLNFAISKIKYETIVNISFWGNKIGRVHHIYSFLNHIGDCCLGIDDFIYMEEGILTISSGYADYKSAKLKTRRL